MNLNQLKYFQVLAKTTHYSRAAEILGISQPSLSYAIKNLEEELNFPLFEKIGRSIKLSSQGQSFLTYLNQSETILTNGIRNIQKKEAENVKTIDIAYIAPLGTYFIPQITKILITKGYNVNLHVKSTPQIAAGIKDGIYDIGLSSQIGNEKQIAFLPILKQVMILLVSKKYILSKTADISLEEISKLDLITYPFNNRLGTIVQTAFSKKGLIPNLRFQVDEESSIAGLVNEGFGVGLGANVPVFNQFNLRKIPLSQELVAQTIYLTYPLENLSENLTELLEIIQNFAKKKNTLFDKYYLPYD